MIDVGNKGEWTLEYCIFYNSRFLWQFLPNQLNVSRCIDVLRRGSDKLRRG